MIERGRGCNKFVLVLRGNGTKIAPTGDICDQPPGEMRLDSGQACRPCMKSCSPIPGRGCFGDLLGDGIVVSPPFPIVEQLYIEAQKRSRVTKLGAQTQHRVVLRLVLPSASKQSEIMCARDKCGVFHNIGKAISGSTEQGSKSRQKLTRIYK